MVEGFLIDTNTVIDYLDNKLPIESNSLIDSVHSQISVITRIELLGWANATEEQTSVLEQFVKTSIVYNLEESVILKVIELRKTISIKLPDAIIAATALQNNLTLITRNKNDFKNLQSLKILDPYQYKLDRK